MSKTPSKALTFKLADYLINANVCKNDRCSNFAVSNAKEYIAPSNYLGFIALHCNKCGSNALLLNNDDINALLLPKINFYLTEITHACPNCYNHNNIHYGKTQQNTVRLQCKACHYVYSYKGFSSKQQMKQQQKLVELSKLFFEDKQTDFKQIIETLKISYSHFYHLLQELEQVCIKNSLLMSNQILSRQTLNISTKSELFLARNSVSLWGITSALSDSGYILLNNINYTQLKISPDSLYDSQQPVVLRNSNAVGINKIMAQYDQFLKRKSFDQLAYHQQKFSDNKYTIIEPVICAYSHFYQLKQYYHPAKTHHYLEHEIVLRSAAMTTYGQEIKNKMSTIYYLYELLKLDTHISSIVRHKIGWWDNDWYELKNADNKTCRFMGLLTPKNKIPEDLMPKLPATLQKVTQFYNCFYQYFPKEKLNKLSPKYIKQLLNIFACFYNFCLTDEQQKTPAQKAGICDKRLTIDALIKFEAQYNSKL